MDVAVEYVLKIMIYCVMPALIILQYALFFWSWRMKRKMERNWEAKDAAREQQKADRERERLRLQCIAEHARQLTLRSSIHGMQTLSDDDDYDDYDAELAGVPWWARRGL